MAFNVRIFGHRGTRQFPQLIQAQFTGSISEALEQPYIWAQLITTAGASPVSSVVIAPPDIAAVVMIEVPDGQSIRYEFNTPGRTGGVVSAGNNSPRLSGVNIFPWTVGTLISIVEASSFP